jgi:hypothetical protein
MKARISILATAALLTVTGLAALPAGATIPGDSRSGYTGSSIPQRWLQAVDCETQAAKKTIRRTTAMIRVGVYEAHAYVHGGAPVNVAKAIVAAGNGEATTPSRSTQSTSVGSRYRDYPH